MTDHEIFLWTLGVTVLMCLLTFAQGLHATNVLARITRMLIRRKRVYRGDVREQANTGVHVDTRPGNVASASFGFAVPGPTQREIDIQEGREQTDDSGFD